MVVGHRCRQNRCSRCTSPADVPRTTEDQACRFGQIATSFGGPAWSQGGRMIASFVDHAREALDKSLEVRESVGVPFGVPLNIYDLCESIVPKVRVRFANYSMEGCYCRSDRPLIEVSALRPLGRRVFSTAHELGHHILGHAGMRLYQNLEYGRSGTRANLDE